MNHRKTPEKAAAFEPLVTVPEVAILIRKTQPIVRKLARLGKLSGARKVGGEWMFSRAAIGRLVL